MGEQEFYYDVSYRRTREGPVGCLRRSELEDVVEWMKENDGRFHFIMILRAAGSPVGLPDHEV